MRAAFGRPCALMRPLGGSWRPASASASEIAEALISSPAFQQKLDISHGEGHSRRVYSSMLELLSDEENPTPLVEIPRSITGMEHTRVFGERRAHPRSQVVGRQARVVQPFWVGQGPRGAYSVMIGV